MAARRAQGLPNTFQDLAMPRLSDDENSAAMLERALPWAEGINQQLADVIAADDCDESELGPEAAAKVAALSDAYARLLPLVRAAVEAEHYQSRTIGTMRKYSHAILSQRLLDQTSKLRTIPRALRLRSRQLVADEQYEEAFDSLMLGLSLARILRHEPTIIGYLLATAYANDTKVAMARLMAKYPLSSSQRQRLEQELALHDDLTIACEGLQSEAIFGMAMLDDLSQSRVARPLTQYWQYQYLRDAATWNDRLQQGPHAFDEANSSTTRGFPVSILIPALDAFSRAAYTDIARTRCLRALIALQATLETHPDAVPTIDSLGLSGNATRDPFSQEPLHLKQVDEGWLIYSVGRDGVDQGGDFEKEADLGYLLPVSSPETPAP
ncbi:MAG: hypothetical protein KF708_09835 [Pirellulales bacterium]|nr:hypothetical protein [Pirellulales bacterium]